MIIAIEGNVGAGKTTLLRTLRSWGYTVVPEPVDAWAHWLDGHGDRAFFQCVVLAWYCALMQRAGIQELARDSTRCLVIERSPYTARHVFASSPSNPLSATYDALYKKATAACNVDVYVFLNTVPSECLRRIKKRRQAGDRAITHEQMHDWDWAHWQAALDLRAAGKEVHVW